MTGLWMNVVLGFATAVAAFGVTIAVVFWLYRLAFGHALRIPMAGFSTTENTLTTAFFGIALAGATVYYYTYFSQDYHYWNTYTLPKYQWIDYVLWSLFLMPSLFWFAGSLFTGKTAPAECEPTETPAGSEGEEADAIS